MPATANDGDGGDDETFPDYQIITTLLYILAPFPSGTSEDTDTAHQSNMLPYHRQRLLSAARAHGLNGAVALLEQPNCNDFLHEQIVEHLHAQSSLQQHKPTTEYIQETVRHYRVRIGISQNGEVTMTTAPTAPLTNPLRPQHLSLPPPVPILCQIHIHPHPIKPTRFTCHKTSNRAVYEQARTACGIPKDTSPLAHEVLLSNTDGEVMECITSAVYFYRSPPPRVWNNNIPTDPVAHRPCDSDNIRSYNSGNRPADSTRSPTEGEGEANASGTMWQTPPLSSGGCASVTRRLALEHGLCVETVIKIQDVRVGETVWLSNAVRGFWAGRVVGG